MGGQITCVSVYYTSAMECICGQIPVQPPDVVQRVVTVPQPSFGSTSPGCTAKRKVLTGRTGPGVNRGVRFGQWMGWGGNDEYHYE